MPRPITEETVQKLRGWCGTLIDSLEEDEGCAYIGADDLAEAVGGKVEYAATNYDPGPKVFDAYALMAAVRDEFTFEEDGYDSFALSRRE